MAGMEQVEIPSKSYIIRWIKVDDGHTISWSVQPHKKSINFGIIKHPGTGNTTLTRFAAGAEESAAGGDSTTTDKQRSRNEQSTAQEQLRSKGFQRVEWHGRYEADLVAMGTYAVGTGMGGMYGLVFDNTFSKTVSKTATFVLLTYPTAAPPNVTPSLAKPPAATTSSAVRPTTAVSSHRTQSPMLSAAAAASEESLQSHSAKSGKSHSSLPHADETVNHFVGVLHKRRRKRGQGYAKRFFSLDFVTCTLSYYYNRNSSKLRGAIPLSLAAITADEYRREISIDSGAEIWHLRAQNARDFDDWARALEKASKIARGVPDAAPLSSQLRVQTSNLQSSSGPDDRQWAQVETLVSRIAGTRDAIQRLATGTAAKKHLPSGLSMTPATPSPKEEMGEFLTPTTEKKPFWRRKSTAPAQPTLRKTPSQQFDSSAANPPPSANGRHRRGPSMSTHQETNIHEHCMSMVRDLDSVLADFATLLAANKRRRMARPLSVVSRASADSNSTAEFFDAEVGDTQSSSQILRVEPPSEDGVPVTEDEFSDALSASSDDDEDDIPSGGTASLFPVKPKSLAPLPLSTVARRRRSVPANTTPPPSLIGFLRKNVGKDLSTISMHVSSNEPLSLLQRVSEQVEYAALLDVAAQDSNPQMRLLYVTAFAISGFSNSRCRERAVRKPFNPMLGETYELIRGSSETPGGFRLVAEKVSHRPVRLALQADAAHWSLTQSPAPTQKFWGKSAELTTDGRVRVVLRLDDSTEERYSWHIATVFLRNVVMGEKYVEPVGTMGVVNESSGARAAIEFRTKGMFSGRSEDVVVETFDPHGAPTNLGLQGTWTASLHMTEGGRTTGREIWRAGDLVDGPNQRYGFTTFAASMNEITAVEQGHLPPTDCRLRPDQRKAEDGDMDAAEDLKVLLEQAQRDRRKDMEMRGELHRPRWFTKVDCDGEEVWRLKGGKEGYWDERAKAQWVGVTDIFRLD